MLSIIICSKHKELKKDLVSNLEKTVGVRFELIHIDNSEGKYSIFEAYNSGITHSKFPFLCFVHEDVLFHTNNWGKKVVEHLSNPETGILGIAGSDMITRVPAGWSVSGQKMHLIQSQKGKKESIEIKIPENFRGKSLDVILLDGVFLCMRKEITEKVKFSEHLKGFHGYDLDISLQSIYAGYINKVAYNILIEHFSKGRKNNLYYRNLIAIYMKWERIIPLYIRKKPTDSEILRLEKKKLDMLLNRVIKRGFTLNESISIYIRYARISGINYSTFKLMRVISKLTAMKIIYFWGSLYYK